MKTVKELAEMIEKTLVKKPKCELTGKDGNVFNLIGIARKSLVKAGMANEAKEMTEKCFKSGSYDEALQTIMEYCDVS